MDAPVIVAVNGAAGGGGMSLVLFADLVLAAESAKFTLAYTRAGLSPDGGSTYFLPRIVGVRRALELALTNRVLSARGSARMGPRHARRADAAAAGRGAGACRAARRGATQALRRGEAAPASQLRRIARDADGARSAGDCRPGAQARDAREGIAAFIAKRKPAFRGS